MNNVLTPFIFGLIIFPISTVFAHPGRTDSSGCHTCRTNCSSWGLSTSEYHCHNAKIAPQPIEPVKSTYGANGTGYTTPAPEYKNTVNSVKPIISPIQIEEKKVSWFTRFINWFK